MKRTFTYLVLGLLLYSVNTLTSTGQVTSHNRNEEKILVFILKDSLELPNTAKGSLKMEEALIKSKSLQKDLSKLNIVSISKAFPKWDASDSLSVTKDGEIIKRPEFDRIFSISFQGKSAADSALKALTSQSSVLFAEKYSTASVDNDPDYINGIQWHLNNDGRNYGVVGADVNAEGAWSNFTGSSSMKIAILDSGVELNHDEFAGRASGDTPSFSHGTMVAGVAAAEGNNGIGGRGLDWETQIISKRIFDWDEVTEEQVFLGDVVAAQKVMDAVDEGAQILNHSWSGPSYSTTLAMSFAYAYKMNRVSVASMGNDFSASKKYPAGFSNTIAVGATRNNDVRSDWSNTGNHIDLVAPGGVDTISTNPRNIYTTTLNNDYTFVCGTSFSAPAVSGLASLLKGYDNSLYNDDIENLIKLSADEVFQMHGADFTEEYGYGRINAGRAFDFLDAPYVLNRWSSSGGSIFNSSASYKMSIYGVTGLASMMYIVTRHEVRKNVTFPQPLLSVESAWGRGVQSNGWSLSSPSYGEGFCEIVPGTLTTTGATLRAYIYRVYNIMGMDYGYFPTSPSNVTFAYTVLGTEIPTVSGSDLVCTSSSSFILNDLPPNSSVTWQKSNNLSWVSPPSSGATSCDVYATTSSTSGEGWIKAVITLPDSTEIEANKNVWVGIPGVPITSPSGYPTIQMSLNEILNINVSSAPGSTNSYYNWSVGGSIDRLSASPSSNCVIEATSVGYGNFHVTSTNGCGTSASGGGSVLVSSSGGGGGRLKVYPNPSTNEITISAVESISSNSLLEGSQIKDNAIPFTILNSNGVLIMKGTLYSKERRIDISKWNKGIYYIVTSTNMKTETTSFVKN